MRRTSVSKCFGAILCAAVSVTTGCDRQRAKESITILSFGGAFADAQRSAYFLPFADSTGVQVNQADYTGEYGVLKAAVEAGAVPWDVVDVESTALRRGVADSIFVPIDYSSLDITGLIPQALHPYGVGTDLYSVSLGFNTAAFPDSAPRPQTWKDFWDMERFPGARALKRDPKFTLEIALLADGVAPESLYVGGNLDVDRAFRSLDRIRPHVKVWWTTGQQPIQLLSDREVVMAAAFGARILEARTEGRPVETTWNDDIIDTEYWAIPKGHRSTTLAHRFIRFAVRPERQAAFSRLFPLGPVNQNALRFLPASVAHSLNTSPENLKRQVFLNADWWAQHEAEVLDRFNRWLGESSSPTP
jgi:putative spermidine/putrescine transport system substrate-binding protein